MFENKEILFKIMETCFINNLLLIFSFKSLTLYLLVHFLLRQVESEKFDFACLAQVKLLKVMTF